MPRLFHLAYLTPRLALCLLVGALQAGAVLAAPPTASDAASTATVQVQDGDMASVLAFRLKPRGSTIEQMMVALLRYNPDAFIQGNVNLLRDGAVLRLPPADEVLRTPVDEARETVQRHHKAYLSDLEGSVAMAMQPRATEAAPRPATSAPEPDPAVEREALLERLRTAKAHLSELQQNIQELERLTREAQASEPSDAAPEAATPVAAVPTSWIWLGVAAIVAVMIGVGSSRRPARKTPAADTPPPADAATAFQTRLGALDLNLDTPASPTSLPGHTP
jgi:pilus assembly protein FimV